MISLYDWKNATCDNRNLNKATQNCLLLICISHCLLKEDILHCTTLINAIPKIKFIYLRKLLWVSKLLVSFKCFIHPAIHTLGPSNMWFTRLLSPKTFIPQTELLYNSMRYLEESIEERSGTLIRRFFKVARTERSSHLCNSGHSLESHSKMWYPEAKFWLEAGSEKQSDYSCLV